MDKKIISKLDSQTVLKRCALKPFQKGFPINMLCRNLFTITQKNLKFKFKKMDNLKNFQKFIS
jgi:hypothetical protein